MLKRYAGPALVIAEMSRRLRKQAGQSGLTQDLELVKIPAFSTFSPSSVRQTVAPWLTRWGQSVAFPLDVYIVFKCLRLALALP